MQSNRSPEKPWYTHAVVALLRDDVPHLSGIAPECVARDVDTLERRLAAEGESFLTKTLPLFGKAIDLALQGDCPLVTSSFKKRGRTALPAFLSALLRRVFKDDGWVRDVPCITSIRLLRQLCFMCKKVQKGYSDESLQKEVLDFIEVDNSLPANVSDLAGASRLLGCARAIIEFALRRLPRVPGNPSHGPGAVAGGENVVEKRALSVSYTDLEQAFRPIPWFRSYRDVTEDLDAFFSRPKQRFGLSRMAFVEKDSSGPRVIGLEPAEYMWCQQSIKDLLYAYIETHAPTAGHVNFTDQTINRELARDWSTFDTLDMSKASDRNSLALVETLFHRIPLWRYMLACRTPGTVLPDGTEFLYKKFAPMGSAVCFPVQALVYYALACASLHISCGMPLTLALQQVYVYGDDLIMPHGYFREVNKDFESVFLKFNMNKCCVSGRFRESCGLDAYDGVEVTPVRLKVVYCKSDADYPHVVEASNMLCAKGYRAAGLNLRQCALRIYPRLRQLNLPKSHREDLPILRWFSEPEDESVRYITRNSLTFVKGWKLQSSAIAASPAIQAACLRESLARGGPVGTLSPSSMRRFDLRYSGKLVKRRFSVIRELKRLP